MAVHHAVGRSAISVAPWPSCPSLGPRTEMTWEPGFAGEKGDEYGLFCQALAQQD